MKKRSFKNLTLNKVSISELQYSLHGGYEEQQEGQEGPADGPAPIAILSIGRICSLRNSCERVCGIYTYSECPGSH